jgi:NAD+ diphosphatase
MINEITPHIFNNTFNNHREVRDNDYILCYKENMILLKQSGDDFEIPTFLDFKDIPEKNFNYLFSLNSNNCFLLQNYLPESEPMKYQDIWILRNFPRKEYAWIGVLGFQLMNWYYSNKFCGRCGSKTELKTDERAIICPDCKNIIYPKISPAVIVAITCEDKILLAKGKNYRGAFHALIAGYVDVGESLEEAVKREVKEEIGLDIRNIRYYKSQPWPFSGSLMVGYFAEANDSQPLKIDEKEIAEAAWFTRGNLPPHASNISISGDMIDTFENETF